MDSLRQCTGEEGNGMDSRGDVHGMNGKEWIVVGNVWERDVMGSLMQWEKEADRMDSLRR